MNGNNLTKHNFTFSQRWAVFEAYEHICVYCREVVHWKDLEVDHILRETLLKEPERLNALIVDYGLDPLLHDIVFCQLAQTYVDSPKRAVAVVLEGSC